MEKGDFIGKLYTIKMLDGRAYRQRLCGENDCARNDEIMEMFGIWFCLMIDTIKEGVSE